VSCRPYRFVKMRSSSFKGEAAPGDGEAAAEVVLSRRSVPPLRAAGGGAHSR
jgi:hypothetical protein